MKKLAEWLIKPFVWLADRLLAFLSWLAKELYALAVGLFEKMLDAMTNVFIWALGLFPDIDLSGADEGLAYMVDLYCGLNGFLPMNELFIAMGILISYYTIFTVIRLIVKLIPGEG